MITVVWSCKHRDVVTGDRRPVACSVCGDTRRMSVIAPPPRFVGTVKPGPCATFRALDAHSAPFEGTR